MTFEPIICPGCKKDINFKCIAVIDEDEPQIQGVSYLIKCSSCGAEFKTGFRKGERVSDEELTDLTKQGRVTQAG